MGLHWDSPGPERTKETLEAAIATARDKGLKWLVVPSTTGQTAKIAAGMIPEDMGLIIVTHVQGYKTPGESEMDASIREDLKERGIAVLTTTHLLANVERAITRGFGGLYPGGIVSATLRMFGQGTKVCVEIATMVLDAGLVPYGEDIVVCGGTGRGLDTALIMQPAHSHVFFEGEIREVIAKPRRVKK